MPSFFRLAFLAGVLVANVAASITVHGNKPLSSGAVITVSETVTVTWTVQDWFGLYSYSLSTDYANATPLFVPSASTTSEASQPSVTDSTNISAGSSNSGANAATLKPTTSVTGNLKRQPANPAAGGPGEEQSTSVSTTSVCVTLTGSVSSTPSAGQCVYTTTGTDTVGTAAFVITSQLGNQNYFFVSQSSPLYLDGINILTLTITANGTSTTAVSSTSSTSTSSATSSTISSTTSTTASSTNSSTSATSTPPPTSDPKSHSETGLSTGAKAGIAIGVVLGVVAILLAAFFIWRRKRLQERNALGGSGYSQAHSATDRNLHPEKEMNVINTDAASYSPIDRNAGFHEAPIPATHERTSGHWNDNREVPADRVSVMSEPYHDTPGQQAVPSHGPPQTNMTPEEQAQWDAEEARIDEAIAAAERRQR